MLLSYIYYDGARSEWVATNLFSARHFGYSSTKYSTYIYSLSTNCHMAGRQSTPGLADGGDACGHEKTS
eukprot:6414068-Pyramimonas_sp.AAC.2